MQRQNELSGTIRFRIRPGKEQQQDPDTLISSVTRRGFPAFHGIPLARGPIPPTVPRRTAGTTKLSTTSAVVADFRPEPEG